MNLTITDHFFARCNQRGIDPVPLLHSVLKMRDRDKIPKVIIHVWDGTNTAIYDHRNGILKTAFKGRHRKKTEIIEFNKNKRKRRGK